MMSGVDPLAGAPGWISPFEKVAAALMEWRKGLPTRERRLQGASAGFLGFYWLVVATVASCR